MIYNHEENKKEDMCFLVVSLNNEGHHYGNSRSYKVPVTYAAEAQKIIEIAYEKLSGVRPIVYFGGVICELKGSGLTKKQLIERIAREHKVDVLEAEEKITKGL